MRPEMDFAGRQILGARERQEDFYGFDLVADDAVLLILADGVGGLAGGDRASSVATEGFVEGFHLGTHSAPHRLEAGLKLANRRVAQALEQDPKATEGMATTLIGAFVQSGNLHWISVGDSLLYLFRNEKLERLNADHSAAGQKIPDLAGNTLVSFLAGGAIPMIDWRREPFELRKGDVILSASDGLLTLPEMETADFLRHGAGKPAVEIVKTLLASVSEKARPKQDNTTVAIIKVP